MGNSIRNDIMGTPEHAEADIEAFGGQVARFRRGLVPDPVFLENRLRHGVYGMRQDNVHMMRSKQPLPKRCRSSETASKPYGSSYGRT